MFRKRSTHLPQLLLIIQRQAKGTTGEAALASMCVRILFLSFEKLVFRQSHNIKETLGEKKNIDLFLVYKSKFTEQVCHCYHHGIISIKEFLIVCRQKFR